MSTEPGPTRQRLTTPSHSLSSTQPGEDGGLDHPRSTTHLLPPCIKRLPAQYSDYIPSDNIVDMLLHLEDNELAMPLPNPLAHPTNHELDTGITANLTSDN